MRSRLHKLVIVVALVLSLAPSLSAYSVLTHEEIVDLLWESNIRPMLLARFPQATPGGTDRGTRLRVRRLHHPGRRLLSLRQ